MIFDIIEAARILIIPFDVLYYIIFQTVLNKQLDNNSTYAKNWKKYDIDILKKIIVKIKFGK